MRIGYSLGSVLSINEVLECSKILSKYNPDSVWIPETWGMEELSMLATVSQIIKNSKIGSSIINIYSRTPSLIAMGAATLDTLSNGRLILGLGTSSESIVQEWHGLEFNQPVQRMREYVEIIRFIMSGNKINYDGKLFQLKNFTLLVKPQRKEIPIYLAAINQKMVELTWEIADGVIFYLRPISELQNTIQKMQSKKKIDVSCQFITCMSEDDEKAIDRAKKILAFYISVGKIYREFLAKNGFTKETREIYDEYKKSGFSTNYKLVSTNMLDSLTICGTPEDCKKKLDKFVKAGVSLPIIQFNPVGEITKSFKLLVSTLSGSKN
ncbi:MAG: LLM class flavin-dependent oxidoreductase [Thaumarchaeota archaeon]|nr:LLM class flavin-dependent oxidoreductase [Nitrososphaerota archaeon]MBI3642187.1 LLM class flavin-dependent oxidoreductase [Nitrososphaerota archaeon]